MSKVKIVQVSKVTPWPSSSQDSTTSSDSISLTYFDLIWLKLQPVQRLFFYTTSSPKAAFYSDILPRLQLSLSVTLSHYSLLSGSLVWPESSSKPYITNKNGGGVSFTVAESDDAADFSRLTGDTGVFVEAEACHPLVPSLVVPELVAIQVTLFPGTGFAIAISTHHAAMDGKSSTSFMRSWAHVCRTGEAELEERLRPFLDRTVIRDEEKIGELYAKQWQDFDGEKSVRMWDLFKFEPGLVRATFTLTPDNIAKLRQLVQSSQQQNGDEQIRPSTFCLTYAYTMLCSVKAEAVLSREHAQVILIVGYDCRSRMEPTVPESYFGNCIGSSIMAVEEPKSLLESHGLLAAVKAVDKTIKGIDKAHQNKKILLSSILSGNFNLNKCARLYTIAGSNKFEVYGVDFGWGRPKKVDIVSIDRTKAFGLSESRNGDGGVEIGLALDKNHMEAFASEFAQGLQ